jgi:hypothetical protein
MGRGPEDIHAYLIGDLLVVRLQGVLTAAEHQLAKSLPGEKGRKLVKQVRMAILPSADYKVSRAVSFLTRMYVHLRPIAACVWRGTGRHGTSFAFVRGR